jgi:hypothetical protein
MASGGNFPGYWTGSTAPCRSHYGYSTNDVKVLAVQYRAREADNPINYITGWYYDSIYDGVDKTVSMILDEESHCPSETLILAGVLPGSVGDTHRAARPREF